MGRDRSSISSIFNQSLTDKTVKIKFKWPNSNQIRKTIFKAKLIKNKTPIINFFYDSNKMLLPQNVQLGSLESAATSMHEGANDEEPKVDSEQDFPNVQRIPIVHCTSGGLNPIRWERIVI